MIMTFLDLQFIILRDLLEQTCLNSRSVHEPKVVPHLRIKILHRIHTRLGLIHLEQALLQNSNEYYHLPFHQAKLLVSLDPVRS